MSVLRAQKMFLFYHASLVDKNIGENNQECAAYLREEAFASVVFIKVVSKEIRIQTIYRAT